MNCTEFEIAAEHAVETRSSLAPAATEHIAICAECRRSWILQQQLNAAIDAWRTVRPSKGLADAVFAELTASPEPFEHDFETLTHDLWDAADENRKSCGIWDERSGSKSSTDVEKHIDAINSVGRRNDPVYLSGTGASPKTRSAALAIATAAVCMVVAALFATRFDGNGAKELADVRHTGTTDVAKTDVPLDLSSTLTEVFSDLKTEYHVMASETTAMARELVIAIPNRVDAGAATNSQNVELLPNSSDMVRMLEPIGSRVESAFGFLWNAIPSEFPSG